MRKEFFGVFLFFAVISVGRGQSGRRGIGDEDERRDLGERRETSAGNQWSNHGSNQQSANHRESEYGQRPNQQSAGEYGSNRETGFGQRPNQGQSGNSRDTDRNRPGQQSTGFYTKEHETEYGQRPDQQSHNNRETDRNKRPGQSSSGSFSSNRENEYNQRPNQQSSTSSSQHTNNRDTDRNKRPNQQSSGSFSNNRESEYNQRPHQQSSGSFSNNRESEYNQRPHQQSSGSFSNNRESEYNQRPHQQSSGSFSNNRETEYNQRPNQQSSGSFSNNRETEYNQRPNQQSSGSFSNNRETEYNQRPNQQSSGQSGTNKRPGGNEYAQRPPTMGSLKPEGSTPLCYGFFGCFSQSEPWTSKLRPVPAPLPPENNSATFNFYSRPNIEQKYIINVYPEFSLGESKFDPRKPTAMIIHGFIQDGNEFWMDEMKNAYLKQVDANVMVVDWGKGSRRLSYLQAAGNTRLIGSMISYLIKRLMDGHGADPSTFHLIGHSLGAQIASYAGKEVPRLGRITALDPAQPGFEGFDKSVRLDKNDAQFVDVIHTNAKPFIPTLGLGMIKPYGHVDFYMNGGFDQPLCVSPPKNAINEIKSILDLASLPVDWFSQTFFCDHARAYSYFTEALNNTDCVFWGHKANLKNVAQGVANTLTQGLLAKYVALSSTCSENDCVPMGFRTQDSSLRGSYVVTTNGKFPYCRSETGIKSQTGDNAQTTSKGKKP